MVSGAVSKLGCTELIFVEPAAKINGEYYRDILLQKLLPAIRRVSGDIFVFEHQDSAPVHRARDTIELLGRSKQIGGHNLPGQTPQVKTPPFVTG